MNKAVPSLPVLHWHFEILGTALSLPFEEEFGLADRVLRLYSHWLTSASNKDRPAVVAANEQDAFQRIFQHLTFVFEERDAEGKVLDRQIQICNSVLEVRTSYYRF